MIITMPQAGHSMPQEKVGERVAVEHKTRRAQDAGVLPGPANLDVPHAHVALRGISLELIDPPAIAQPADETVESSSL